MVASNSKPPTLIDDEELDGFPGGPYKKAVVKSAVASVRAEAGWHVAPEWEHTETVQVRDSLVLLRSLHVTDVSTVTDVTDPDNPVELTGWTWYESGIIELRRSCLQPARPHKIEVEYTDGYDECPAELLPVIADRCQQSGVSSAVRQETSANESVTYASTARSAKTDERVQRYRIVPSP